MIIVILKEEVYQQMGVINCTQALVGWPESACRRYELVQWPGDPLTGRDKASIFYTCALARIYTASCVALALFLWVPCHHHVTLTS